MVLYGVLAFLVIVILGMLISGHNKEELIEELEKDSSDIWIREHYVLF